VHGILNKKKKKKKKKKHQQKNNNYLAVLCSDVTTAILQAGQTKFFKQ